MQACARKDNNATTATRTYQPCLCGEGGGQEEDQGVVRKKRTRTHTPKTDHSAKGQAPLSFRTKKYKKRCLTFNSHAKR